MERSINYDYAYSDERDYGDFSIDLSLAKEWSGSGISLDWIANYVVAATKIIPFNIINKFMLSIVFSTDNEIQQYNRDYRKKDKPTNVLSFQGYDEIEDLTSKSECEQLEVSLGDIVIAYETAKKEADEANQDFLYYTSTLLVHGLLHLLQFHHETDEEEDLMNNLAKKILEFKK